MPELLPVALAIVSLFTLGGVGYLLLPVLLKRGGQASVLAKVTPVGYHGNHWISSSTANPTLAILGTTAAVPIPAEPIAPPPPMRPPLRLVPKPPPVPPVSTPPPIPWGRFLTVARWGTAVGVFFTVLLWPSKAGETPEELIEDDLERNPQVKEIVQADLQVLLQELQKGNPDALLTLQWMIRHLEQELAGPNFHFQYTRDLVQKTLDELKQLEWDSRPYFDYQSPHATRILNEADGGGDVPESDPATESDEGSSDAADDSEASDGEEIVTDWHEWRRRQLEREQMEQEEQQQESDDSPRPDQKFPASQLPTDGDRPYVAPKEKGNPDVKKAPHGSGYIDRDGNVWEWAKDQHGGPHWDVQHPDGSHTNVFPDGTVLGPDNFTNKRRSNQ